MTPFVRTKAPSTGISRAIHFWFPAALPEYLMGGSELSGKCMNFKSCVDKVNVMTLIVQEMQKSPKGSLKLIFAGAVFVLLALLFWSPGLSNSIQTTLFNLFWHCYF